MNKLLFAFILSIVVASLLHAQDNYNNSYDNSEDSFQTSPSLDTQDPSVISADNALNGVPDEPVRKEKHKQPSIDVDGSYKTRQLQHSQLEVLPKPRPLTQADKMKLVREKLEKRNELLVKKQIERLRMQQEIEMTKRIQKTFNDSMKKLETMN